MRVRRAKVRLTKSVRDMAGSAHPEGREVDVLFALDGVPEVIGAGYLPLNRDEWEPVISDEDLRRLLGER